MLEPKGWCILSMRRCSTQLQHQTQTEVCNPRPNLYFYLLYLLFGGKSGSYSVIISGYLFNRGSPLDLQIEATSLDKSE